MFSSTEMSHVGPVVLGKKYHVAHDIYSFIHLPMQSWVDSLTAAYKCCCHLQLIAVFSEIHTTVLGYRIIYIYIYILITIE